ncbi:MAG: carbon-nitrogen hydrolase family protein [Planctomycetota bacterium]|nr:carbon-nitrogen hydrolase family protein [Planctomycetota bacterium]MDA1139225.1 carbon-nitrogen hydrolase family protein [Planctomycetota bacterium]
MRVAGAQIPVLTEIKANVAAIERAIDYAAGEHADVLLTPEGSLSGYTPEFDSDAVNQALERITKKAREANLGLALGTCFVELEDGLCYNQIRFYDKHGEYLGFHSKTLRCGTLEDQPKGEINHYSATPLSVRSMGGISIGGLICNDLWANPACTPMPDPHLTQQLTQMGAKIIFHAVNGGRSGNEWSEVNWRFHESNLRMRARSGRLWIVTVDNCHPPEWPCSSPSGVVRPNGDWVVQTRPKGEQFFVCDIEAEEGANA